MHSLLTFSSVMRCPQMRSNRALQPKQHPIMQSAQCCLTRTADPSKTLTLMVVLHCIVFKHLYSTSSGVNRSEALVVAMTILFFLFMH